MSTETLHRQLGDPFPVPREGGGVRLGYDIEDIRALQHHIRVYFNTPYKRFTNGDQSAKAEGGKE